MAQNPSVQFVISYVTLGQTFQRSVIFINTPDTQLVFRLTAPKADFNALDDVFRRSISSWQWTETKPGQTAPGVITANPVQAQPGAPALR